MRKQKNETVILKKGKRDIQLDYAELRKAVLVLRAINHKLRQNIIDLLETNDKIGYTFACKYSSDERNNRFCLLNDDGLIILRICTNPSA